MGIRQCIKNILSFGASNEAVDSELAQQLAEAIRTGKIVLEVEEQNSVNVLQLRNR